MECRQRVSGGDGKYRACAGADLARGARRVLDAGERCCGGGYGLADTRLAGDAGRHGLGRMCATDRTLPIERDAAHGARGHGAERMADEEDHRTE